MITRKGIAIPSWVMVLSFIIGLLLVVIWGVQAIITNANLMAESFSALGVLFSQGIFTVILVGVLLLLTIKMWFIFIPLWAGMFVGFLIVTYLDLMGGLT